MKKLLLLALVLNFCCFLKSQAQSQTPSLERSKSSSHSKHAGFAKPPYSWLKEMEGDSSDAFLQDERLRSALPPHLRGMKNLPPHILAERQWLLQSEAENAPTGAAGLEPDNPFDRLYSPHERPAATSRHPLKNNAPHHSFQSGSTQILSGGVQEAWVARYDEPGSSSDYAQAMVVDAAGNIYVMGYSKSFSNSPDLDYVTVKYDAAGIKQWTSRYGGPGNSYDQPAALAVDAAGNVYVTGGSGENYYAADYVTVKYNSAGTQEWVATYDGPGSGYDYPRAIAVDNSGNVYVTGSSLTGTNYDYATVKYDAAGTQEWVATYNGSGNHIDIPVALAVDGTGNVNVTGYSWNGTSSDYATIKYNSTGTQQWVATYNGPKNGHDYAVALGIDAASNVYVTGSSGTIKYNSAGTQEWVASGSRKALAIDGAGNVYVTGSSASYDYVTIKYNSAGTKNWGKTYNGPGDAYDVAKALAVDGAGNVYVTGYSYGLGTSYDFATVKYNSAGTQEWVKTFVSRSDNDHPVALAVDAAGNVCVTGTSAGSCTSWDYVTVKYDAFGVAQWLARHDEPGPSNNSATAMAIDGSGNIYVTGHNCSQYITVKYDGAGVQQWVARYKKPEDGPNLAMAVAVDGTGNVYVMGTIGTHPNYDYVTIKYNSTGQEQWIARYNGPGNEYDIASALAVDGAGNVYVTGTSGIHPHVDYATIKYNNAGQEQWVARYNGLGNAWDGASALAVDDARNVYVTGASVGSGTGYDFATIKYNSAGQEQWVARYNGPTGNDDDYARALAVDSHGNV